MDLDINREQDINKLRWVIILQDVTTRRGKRKKEKKKERKKERSDEQKLKRLSHRLN